MLLKGENIHGGDVYSNKVLLDYSANVSPLGIPLAVKEAMINSIDSLVQYPDPYCKRLREKISCYEQVSYDYIICGNGAADVIFDFATALKPQKALVVAPTFGEYEKALKANGCKIDYYYLSKENDFQLTEDFFCTLKSEYGLLIICNPNNPTGQIYPQKIMLQIADFCKNNGIYFFIDECFIDLTDTPEKFTLSQYIHENEKIFILKAFTKSFGMAGVRLGYGMCSDTRLLEKMSKVSQAWNVSSVAQIAGCAAIDSRDYLNALRQLIKNERAFLYKELTDLGFKVYLGKANFLLFNAESDLYEKLMKRGIMLRRCSNFDGLDNTFYRCAVRKHSDNIRLVTALKERE